MDEQVIPWLRGITEIGSDLDTKTEIEWTDPQDIARILDILACSGEMTAVLSKAFNLENVVIPGTACIGKMLEIPTENGVILCLPEKLRLEYLPDNPKQSFLWLDIWPIPVSPFAQAMGHGPVERLCEVSAGVYLAGKHWDSHTLPNGHPIPDYSRLLWRCTSGRILFARTGATADGMQTADSVAMARLYAERA